MLVIGGAVMAALVGITGAAYAVWSSNAEGSGTARSTIAVNATINPSSGEPDLYPGYNDGDVYFTVENPNDYDIQYTGMTPGVITSDDQVNCDAANVTVEPMTGLTLMAPAADTTGQLVIEDVVTMAINAPDTCQGRSFDVVLTLTGVQTGA
jgi:hypothetical protein